jgi:hypothetical protein
VLLSYGKQEYSGLWRFRPYALSIKMQNEERIFTQMDEITGDVGA